MPTVFALVSERFSFFDNNSNFASGAKLFVYTAGSSTKATSFQESDGVTANSNPIVLNSRGEMPAGCYVESGVYKLVLAPATDTDPPTSPFWTRDNLSPINDTATTVDQFLASGFSPTFLTSTTFSVPGDQRSSFETGKRLKTSNSGGTGYHTVVSAAFGSVTTVTVTNDSTALDSGLSSVSLSLLSASASAVPHTKSDASGLTVENDLTVDGTTAVQALTVAGALTLSGVATGDFPLPATWLNGLGMTNAADASHDITVAVGAARDSTDGANLRLASAITKQLDVDWAEGSAAGGFPSGLTLAADTFYRCFLIGKADGTVDAGFDTSATAANLLADATGYTLYRRIGWVLTDGSSNIIPFIQTGNKFLWTDPGTNGLDVSNASVTTSESTVTLDHCPQEVEGILNIGLSATEIAYAWIYPTSVTSAAVAGQAATLGNVGSQNVSSGATNIHVDELRIEIDASRQIHARAVSTVTMDIQVMGWIDERIAA